MDMTTMCIQDNQSSITSSTSSSSSSSSASPSSGTTPYSQKRKRKSFPVLRIGSGIEGDTSSILDEGESRRERFRRNTRVIMDIQHSLYSLRLSWRRGRAYRADENTPNLFEQKLDGELYRQRNIRQHVAMLNSVVQRDSDTTFTSYDQYNAAIILDTMLPYWVVQNEPNEFHNTEALDPIIPSGLADYSSIVQYVMASVITVTVSARHHIVCKLFPRKAMPRRFDQKLQEYIQMESESIFRFEISEMILCSLLGNYPHCPMGSRADLNMRLRLYKLAMPYTFRHYHTSPKVEVHLRNILHNSAIGSLNLLALREYLVYLIDDDPALRIHANRVFEYEKFRSITIEVMAKVRIYIRNNLKDQYKCKVPPPEDKDSGDDDKSADIGGDSKWEIVDGTMTEDKIEFEYHIRDINAIVTLSYDETVEDASYRKPREPPMELLRSNKGKIPPSMKWAQKLKQPTHYYSEPTSDEKCKITRNKSKAEKLSRKSVAKPILETSTAARADDDEDKEDDDDGGESKEEKLEEAKLARLDPLISMLADIDNGVDTKKNGRKRGKGSSEADPMEIYNKRIKYGDGGIGGLSELWEEITGRARVATDTTKTTVTTESKPREIWEPRGPKEPKLENSMVITRDCIQVRHSELLCEYVATIDPNKITAVDAFELIMDYLPILGASRVAINRHKKLSGEQHHATYTGTVWERQINVLRDRYPYTYNLIQAASFAWLRHSALRICPLPLHYVSSGSIAIANSYHIPIEEFKTEETGLPLPTCAEERKVPSILPDQPVQLYYCDVCRRPYSITRRKPPPPRKTVKRQKPLLTHGFTDAFVNLRTGHVYCNKKRSVMHMKCGRKPLSRICLLGNELIFKKHSYRICCQPGCGQIALMHPLYTTINSHGLACYSCALEINNELRHRAASPEYTLIKERIKNNKQRKSKTLTTEEKASNRFTCFLHHGVTMSPANAFIFGMDTYLCSDHKIEKICYYIAGHLQSSGISQYVTIETNDDEEEETRRLILEFDAHHKEEAKKKNEARHKRNVANTKRAILTKSILRR
jgi:hypothetical protein